MKAKIEKTIEGYVNAEFIDPKKQPVLAEINDVGRRLSKDYIVTINYKLPYISLTNSQNSIWFSQGEDAQNLIDEIPSNIKPEYYLLWYLESAGVF